MNKKIRVVHYGIGHDHSPQFLACILQYPELFEVVGVCEPNEKMWDKFSEFEVYSKVPRLTEDEMFSLEDIDAAIVEAYDLDLVSYAQKCADKGWHIHMDKAAGTDIVAYKKLLTTLKQKNLVFQMGYMYRYNYMVKKALEMKEKGELGEILAVDAFMNTCHPAEKREWMSHLPGGDMLYLGCHMVDLVYLFMGVPNKIHCFSKNTRLDGIVFPDNACAVFEYDKGVGLIRASAVEVNGFGRRQLVVSGSKGSVEIKPLEAPTIGRFCSIEEHTTYGDRAREEKAPVGGPWERYDEMMLDFAAYIRGEKANPFTMEYEYRLQKMIFAACGEDIDYRIEENL